MIIGALDGLRGTSLAGMRVLLDDLFDLHASNPGTLANSFAGTVAPIPSSGRFNAGILTPSGRVVFLPQGGSTIDFWDPATPGAITVGPAHGFGANTPFRWGCLLADGRVFMVPTNQQVFLIFNPTTLQITQSPAHGINFITPGPNFGAVTLGADDRVYLAGNSDDRVCIYDPISNTVSFGASMGFTPSGAQQYNAALLMGGGDILFFPRQDNGIIRRYTPSTNTMVAAGTSQAGIDFATPMRGGEILLIGFAATTLRIYNVVTQQVRTGPAHGIAGGFPISGAVPMRDGRVALFPRRGQNIAIYDPATGAVTAAASTGGVTTVDNWIHAVGLLNGTYMLIGSAIQQIGIWTDYTGGITGDARVGRILNTLRLARHFNRR